METSSKSKKSGKAVYGLAGAVARDAITGRSPGRKPIFTTEGAESQRGSGFAFFAAAKRERLTFSACHKESMKWFFSVPLCPLW
ncbi:MAG: hypothetical protein ACJAV3_000855 [Alcanivorax sp.]|jgi:hypothetical protein